MAVVLTLVSKGVPRQAEVAQGVPGRLRPRIILTFRHYNGGRSSAKRSGRLYPRRNPWYSLSEAESTSGHMVLSGEPRKKSPVTTPEIDSGTVRLVAQSLNHYATPVPLTLIQSKQVSINIHKRNNTKRSTNNTKHSKYKYTYYQNTHTLQNKL